MLNNVMIGRYYPIKSKVHRMNPLAKLICMLLFIILSFLSTTIIINIIIMGIIILIIGLTNIPFKVYFKAIYGLKFLILFIFLINLLFGTNLVIVVIMLLRLISFILYASILTLTTTPTEISHGLEQLFSPLKIIGLGVSKMALSISLALRFIPTIVDQANMILKAQASRGVDYNNINLRGKLKAIKSMIIPMFILSFKRADALADAMEVRLYNINKKRTNYRITRWRLFDYYIVLMHILMVGLLVARVVIK